MAFGRGKVIRAPDRVPIPLDGLISTTVGLRNTDMYLGGKCVGWVLRKVRVGKRGQIRSKYIVYM